jgi:hypothetical protein
MLRDAPKRGAPQHEGFLWDLQQYPHPEEPPPGGVSNRALLSMRVCVGFGNGSQGMDASRHALHAFEPPLGGVSKRALLSMRFFFGGDNSLLILRKPERLSRRMQVQRRPESDLAFFLRCGLGGSN